MNKDKIRAVMAVNGNDISDEDFDVLDDLRIRMERMSQSQRITVFQVLGDFYCPRCGIDQPYGDCQCGRIGG